MQASSQEKQRDQMSFPGLPLAVYREIATHLRQIEGVETGLIPQQSQQFDYYQSQVGALWIEYSDPACRQRVEQILGYYSDRYCPWEKDETQTSS